MSYINSQDVLGSRKHVGQGTHLPRKSRLPRIHVHSVPHLNSKFLSRARTLFVGRGCSVERNVYSTFTDDKASLETEKGEKVHSCPSLQDIPACVTVPFQAEANAVVILTVF